MKPDSMTIGVLGSDFPGVKPALAVTEGVRVSAGEVLFQDKRDPRICAYSPVSGLVNPIHQGIGRSLTSISIVAEGEVGERGHDLDATVPTDFSGLTNLLIDSGLWARLRQRPFGTIPLTGCRPCTLFVTALDTRPEAHDAAAQIHMEMDSFKLGLEVFSLLPTGETILCLRQPQVIQLSSQRPIRQITFSRDHPCGLPGTAIHRLSNPTPENPIYVVEASTVIALGRLLNAVSTDPVRNIAISGIGVTRPGLYPALPGASIRMLLEQAGGNFDLPGTRVIAGSAIAGRRVGINNAFLGMSEHQLQVLDEPPLISSGGLSFIDRTSFLARVALNRFFPQMGTNMHGAMTGMVTAESIERVWPHNVPVFPLLRALLTGDDETALALGALAFVEEDMSLVSWACPAKYNYGQALRAFLDRVLLGMS